MYFGLNISYSHQTVHHTQLSFSFKYIFLTSNRCKDFFVCFLVVFLIIYFPKSNKYKYILWIVYLMLYLLIYFQNLKKIQIRFMECVPRVIFTYLFIYFPKPKKIQVRFMDCLPHAIFPYCYSFLCFLMQFLSRPVVLSLFQLDTLDSTLDIVITIVWLSFVHIHR